MPAWKRVFYFAWPYANALYEGTFFLYIISYLFGYTMYYTPLLHLQKLKLTRLSIEDMVTFYFNFFISILLFFLIFQKDFTKEK